jgi:MFS family permease
MIPGGVSLLPPPPSSSSPQSATRERLLNLFLFSCGTFINAVMFLSFASIRPFLEDYFDLATDAGLVDFMSSVFLVSYILFFVPAAWVFERFGLRVGVIVGAVVNATAAWIRYWGGSRPDGFAILFVGQSLAAIGQCFFLFVPSRLATVWFPENQQSTAAAVGIAANQAGLAVGLGASFFFVQIDSELANFLLIQAAFTSVLLLFTLFLFRSDPPSPHVQVAFRAAFLWIFLFFLFLLLVYECADWCQTNWHGCFVSEKSA